MKKNVIHHLLVVAILALLLPSTKTIAQNLSGNDLHNATVGALVVDEQLQVIQSSDQRIKLNERKLAITLNTGSVHRMYVSDSWECELQCLVKVYAGAVLLKEYPALFTLNNTNVNQTVVINYSDIASVATKYEVEKVSYQTTTNETILPTSVIDSEVKFAVTELNDIGYDISSNGYSPIEVEVSEFSIEPHPETLPLTYNTEKGDYDVSRVLFSWSVPEDVYFSSYDLEVLKIEPGVDGEGTFHVDVNWKSTSTIEVTAETGVNDIEYEMTLTQGTGFYLWRVRPIGSYYPGGRQDIRNYGNWSEYETDNDVQTLYTYSPSTPNVPVAQISDNLNSSESAITGKSLFYYRQFDEDINFIYGKVLTESSRQSETMTWANGLNQVYQTQTRLFSQKIVGTQSVYDYSGRPALQSLPAPTEASNLGYKKDFFVSANPLHSGDPYAAKDFDHGDNDEIYSPSKVQSGVSGTPGYYYSDDNIEDPYVASAGDDETVGGFPYARTVFYPDATGRVYQQSGPGETMKLDKSVTNGHNVFSQYGSVSQTELDRVFGTEAPIDSSVYKVVTTDPNNVNSVSYISKSGQVLATCLSNANSTNLLPLNDEPGLEDGFTVVDRFTEGKVTDGERFSVAQKKVVVDRDAMTVGIDYNLTPKAFQAACSKPDPGETFCYECDYRIEIEIQNVGEPEATGKNITMTIPIPPESLEELTNCTGQQGVFNIWANKDDIIFDPPSGDLQSSLYSNGEVDLPFGTYIIEKRVYVDNEVVAPDPIPDNYIPLTYLDERITELKAAAELWDKDNNCCGPFTPDTRGWDCSNSAAFCESDGVDFENTGFDGLDNFIDEVLVYVGKEQSAYLLNPDGTESTTLYTDALAGKGAMLLSNKYDTYAEIEEIVTHIIANDPNAQCQLFGSCLETAKAYFENNLSMASSYGYQTSVNANGLPATNQGPTYDPDFDFLQVLFGCSGENYGLTARYYGHNHLSLANDWTQWASEPATSNEFFEKRLDPYINMSSGNELVLKGVAKSNYLYSIVWTGFITTPDETGSYQFEADYDDGVKVFIEDMVNPISGLSEWGTRSSSTITPITGTKTLQANMRYRIRVETFENTGTQGMVLSWKIPGTSTFEVIPFYAFSPECNGVDEIAIVSSSSNLPTPANQAVDVLYVQVPGTDQSPALPEALNRECLSAYFTDDVNNIVSEPYSLVDYNPTNAIDLDNAVAKACICLHDISSPVTAPSGIDDLIMGEQVSACEQACNNKASMFESSIDGYVRKYNLEENDLVDPEDSQWDASPNFDEADIPCFVETMMGQCLEQCELEYMHDIDPNQVGDPAYDALVLQDFFEFQQASNGSVDFAPKITGGGGYTEVPASEQKTVQNQIIDFIYKALDDGMNKRIMTGEVGVDVVDFDLYANGTAPVNGTYFNHQELEVIYPYMNGTTLVNKTFTVVVNTLWDPGTDLVDLADDDLEEINYSFHCTTSSGAFLMLDRGFTEDFSFGLGDIKNNVIEVFIDGSDQWHSIAKQLGGQGSSANIAFDGVSETASFDILTSPSTENYAYVELYYGTDALQVMNTAVEWQGTASTTADAIADAINAYQGLPEITAIANGASVDLEANTKDFPGGLSNYVLVIDGDLVDQSSISDFELEANSTFTASMSSCSAGSYSESCPYGYNEVTSPTYVTHKSERLEHYFTTYLIPFVYQELNAALAKGLNGDGYDYNTSIDGKPIKFSIYDEDYEYWVIVDESVDGTGIGKFTIWTKGCSNGSPKNTSFSLSGSISGATFTKIFPAVSSTNDFHDVITFSFTLDYALEVQSLDPNDGVFAIGWTNEGAGLKVNLDRFSNWSTNPTNQFWYDVENVWVACGSTTSSCPVCMRWNQPSDIDANNGYQVPTEFFSCESELAKYEDEQVANYLANCLNGQIEGMEASYKTNCLDQIEDDMELTYDVNYYHYTLYYYDRAGNLVRTVPPEGVNAIITQNESTPEGKADAVAVMVDDVQATRATYPDLSVVEKQWSDLHHLVTHYHYNSIKQLVKQETPDGGITQFWYNAAGQLRLSQDAEQAADDDYSYTKYDKLGRIIEVGEVHDPTLTKLMDTEPDPDEEEQGGQIINEIWGAGTEDFPGSSSTKTEVNHTVYSEPAIGITYLGEGQTHLRNRISYVYRDPNGMDADGDELYTYYSYDPHGNVKWVINEIPGLGRKSVKYDYDLVSGNVNQVIYMENTPEQFIHKYTYDADNRIQEVFTSTDGNIWNKDAKYQYYDHGPLKRTEIGHDMIQGQDYVYTIEGYLKTINQPSHVAAYDPGQDGIDNNGFLKDEFSMELGYYADDYTRTGTHIGTSSEYDAYTVSGGTPSALYNGNISWWASNIRRGSVTEGSSNANDPGNEIGLKMRHFRYDKLNRIKEATFKEFENDAWVNTNNQYNESFTYDGNGNILNTTRNGYDIGGNVAMDDIDYTYQTANADGSGKITENRLYHVKDNVTTSNYGGRDILINSDPTLSLTMNDGSNNYEYDE